LGLSFGIANAVKYQITILDINSEYRPYGDFAHAINNKGQTAGAGTDGSYFGASLWTNGSMVKLGQLGSSTSVFPSIARGINDNAVVVGESAAITPYEHAFKWENGIMTDLGAPGNLGSYAYAINNKGAIVGDYEYSFCGSQTSRGIIWQANGNVTLLNSGGPAGTFSTAKDINNSGIAVGAYREYGKTVACYWLANQSTPTLVSGIRTDVQSAVCAINDFGDMIGNYQNSNYTGCGNFVCIDGKVIQLTGLGSAYLQGINNQRQVIGSTSNGDGTNHLFVWSEKDGYTYLDQSLVDPFEGQLLDLNAINDAGVMCGDVYLDGNYRAVTFSPVESVPEPASLIALGACILIVIRRKKKHP
jgi:probable HAF family extracellular repeat protein